ncbi:MAG: hypothetical protein IKL74_01975 [Clostridia bacterium]|nr:hypothetical protein [Clostridia bacterium]
MIEQQIYIKTGIGLETSSKSTTLTEEYIDNAIRPFYSMLDLFYLEGKDSPGYKSFIPLSGGGLLIGTGMKSATKPYSCIHNYIIPQDDVSAVVSDPAAILALPEPDDAKNPYLPSLKELPFTKERSTFLKKAFASLNMSHTEYMALLAAVFASVEQNRKIFIALPRKTDIDEICAIMYGLYEYLPYFMRSKTGFCTLFGETEIRPEINIYFIPDDKVSPGGRFSIESYDASKDYIFNFSKKNRSQVPDTKEALSEEYLSFVSTSFATGASLSDFFAFAREAERAFPTEKILSLRFYNDLAYIYNLKDNEETLPQRLGRITTVFAEFLRSDDKPGLLASYSEFIKLYRRYIKSKEILIPPEILKRLVSTYDLCPEKQKDELYDLITLDIDSCLKSSENEILFMHIDSSRGSSELYNKLIEHKMAKSNRLITRYFTYLIEQRKTVHSVMEFADSIFSEMPQLADSELIISMIQQRAMQLYDTSGDRFEAVKYLEEKCLALKDKHPDNAALFNVIYRYALENYMTTLDISELNLAKIEKFPLADGEAINEECTVKHKIAMAAKEIMALTNDMAMSFVHYDAFGFENIRANFADSQSDGKAKEDLLKTLLLRCIKEKKDSPRRIVYIILFYIYGSKDSRAQVDFDSILEFIDKEQSIPPFEFIEWFLSSNLFIPPMTKNGRIVRDIPGIRTDFTVLTSFYESLRKFFIRHNTLLTNDRNIKKLKKELDNVSVLHPEYKDLTLEFKKVISGIVSEHYSPIKRVFNKIVSGKNFKFMVLIASIAIIVFGGIAIGGLFTAKNNDETIATLNASTGEKAFVNKTGWSAYKIEKDTSYLPAAAVLDETDSAEVIDFLHDKTLMVEFPGKEGLVIDGVSISAVLSDEHMKMEVHIYDSEGNKLSVGVSDYDITTGASLYTFTKPICVKKISVTPKTDTGAGTITVKEISAYLVK